MNGLNQASEAERLTYFLSENGKINLTQVYQVQYALKSFMVINMYLK